MDLLELRALVESEQTSLQAFLDQVKEEVAYRRGRITVLKELLTKLEEEHGADMDD